MSNSLAIAAVTATLQKMLNDTDRGITANLPQDVPNNLGLSSVSVTTNPPDKARGQNENSNQVNIYLYQTVPNAALRNMDMPRQVRPGETAQPPVALTLHYLLSAYGKDNNDTAAHILLGQTMRIFHDNAVLDQEAIKDALAGNDLHEQVERVRLTQYPLSLEEISKLWTAFQTQYRISAAYQVEVVLIESTRAVNSALPVLKRGSRDQGVTTVASPSPSITDVSPDVQPPGAQSSGNLGDILNIKGEHLGSDGIVVRFIRQPPPALPALPETVTITPLSGGNEDRIRVPLLGADKDPNALAKWAPGFYSVSLVVTLPNLPPWTTNEVPFALAPAITVTPSSGAPVANTSFELTVTCAPRLRDGQRVLLLFANRQIPVKTISTPSDASKPTTLTFQAPAAVAGKYVIRLRVDGVDSLPIVRTGTPPILDFDPNQTVTIP